ncbi:hypothetical protein CEXT_346201 [Caerostris extrusa]|uniref:Uncharacterized protein n=1 Tax=Caerostris extrusa TaxID=172846 RepID=A0AAV4WAD8_CAEEX|nr:hypothetical protein CEXT_346201 [Caerostris extrusa]
MCDGIEEIAVYEELRRLRFGFSHDNRHVQDLHPIWLHVHLMVSVAASRKVKIPSPTIVSYLWSSLIAL